jgi:hypothetical protein
MRLPLGPLQLTKPTPTHVAQKEPRKTAEARSTAGLRKFERHRALGGLELSADRISRVALGVAGGLALLYA